MNRFNFYVFFHIIFSVVLCRAEESETIPVLETQFVNKLVSSATHADLLLAVQEFIATNPDVPPHKMVVSYDIDNTVSFEMNRIFAHNLLIEHTPRENWTEIDKHIDSIFFSCFQHETDVIDPSFYSTFNALHDMGVTLIATTARRADISEETEELLKKNSIFFAKDTDNHIFPSSRGRFIISRPHAPELSFYFSEKSVLYTNGHAKGDVLMFLIKKAFEKHKSFDPKFFVHIDDSRIHCENIYDTLMALNIPVTVVHYNHAPHTLFKDMEELEAYLQEKGKNNVLA